MKPWDLNERVVRRGLGNLSLLRHRHFDGFIVSMHQSGTHWLKYMLSLVIAENFDIAPPRHIGDNSVVGHPRDTVRHEGAPQIVHSHSIPSPLVHTWASRAILEFPRYVLLVRDPRVALVSHFEKWKDEYGVDFSEYLRGDPSGKRYDKDIWWQLRFLNTWSAVRRALPERVLVLRYEALTHDPAHHLGRIWRYLRLAPVSQGSFTRAAHAATKSAMAAIESPAERSKVVREDQRPALEWYNTRDRQFSDEQFSTRLVDDFGYELRDWPSSDNA